jgi:hypothetical protein
VDEGHLKRRRKFGEPTPSKNPVGMVIVQKTKDKKKSKFPEKIG